jgi:hypothetical protein
MTQYTLAYKFKFSLTKYANYQMCITYLLTYLLHGAEPFLRS